MTVDRPVRMVAPPEVPGATISFAGCSLLRLPSFADERGVLSVAELGAGLPFEAKRCFFIHAVPDGARRGGHSLARSTVVMIGVHGSMTVDIDDGETCWSVVLDEPSVALHIPTGIWSEEHSFSADGVLMVLASNVYDPDEFDCERPSGLADA